MTPEEIKALQDKVTALETENATLKKPPAPPEPKPTDPPPAPDDKGLREKAEKDRLDAENRKNENQRLERAIGFNQSVNEFVKDNQNSLPEEVEAIIKKANEVSYDTQIEKSIAIKGAVLESFFAVKENVDRLTASQKANLDSFLKLTKNAKEKRVEDLYDNVFEPSLKSLKEIRKATELEKQRLGLSPNNADAMVKRISEISQKHYLGKAQEK